MALPAKLPEAETANEPGPPLWPAFALSLAFHALLLTTVPMFHQGNQIPAAPPEKIVKVRFTPPEVSDPPDGQVVDVMDEASITESPPENAEFLSDRNRRVKDQTQARMTGPMQQQSASNSQPSESQSPSREKKGNQFDLNLPNEFLQQDSPRSTGHRSPSTASLAPSNYLPEIALGDETLLNTREYVYASFFIRMKRQMEAVWNPQRVLERTALHRSYYITKVSIILNREGRLRNVHLLDSSGRRDLDQEALRAVKQAAPYLNPPKGVVDADGLIRIPNWHFIVTYRSVF